LRVQRKATFGTDKKGARPPLAMPSPKGGSVHGAAACWGGESVDAESNLRIPSFSNPACAIRRKRSRAERGLLREIGFRNDAKHPGSSEPHIPSRDGARGEDLVCSSTARLVPSDLNALLIEQATKDARDADEEGGAPRFLAPRIADPHVLPRFG